MKTYSKKINSNDIALAAGVSQATVSRVLSGSANVSKKTKERVLEVIAELDYTPDPFARAMRNGLTGTIGVAVSRITNPIVPEILLSLARYLHGKGKQMIVWNTDIEGEDGIIKAVKHKVIDGMIFTAASHQAKAISVTLKEDLPVVSFNRYLEEANCDQVVSNNLESSQIIVEYLLHHRRKKIAMINGPQDRTTLFDREVGVRQKLNELGHELADHHYARSHFEAGDFGKLAVDMMKNKDRPDAIVCGNDVIATAVYCELKSAGFSIPDDVWITGFDGIEMSGWSVFDITTMCQPLNDMAAQAVDSLIARIEGQYNTSKIIKFRSTFIIRGSTAHALYKQDS